MIRFERNRTGRDFVVGDVHGCFDRLRAALEAVEFDEAADRLFSVGDLVDRGHQSYEAVDWLDKPWFFAVKGNHEAMAVNYEDGHNHAFHYERNGGRWFINLPDAEQARIARVFAELPLAIEVDTPNGTFGLVHAEVPHDDWSRCDDDEHTSLWARDRHYNMDDSLVAGIDRVYVGHTPLQAPEQLGNVFYIDTGAVFGGPLTLVCITDDTVTQHFAEPRYTVTDTGRAMLKDGE